MPRLPLPRWIADNGWIKVFSVLMAVLLWYLVNGEGNVQKIIKVPLSTRVPEGYMVSSLSAREISVNLLGTRVAMLGADLSDIAYEPLDLSGSEPGTVSVVLRPQGFSGIPLGLEVVQIDPARVIVQLDRRVEKTLTILPQPVGLPADGYLLGEIRLTPSRVTLVGAASAVDPLFQLLTDPIALTNRREGFRLTVPVAVPESAAVTVTPPQVEAEAIILEEPQTRPFDLPVLAPPLDPRVEFDGSTPLTVRVKVEGPRLVLEGIESLSEYGVRVDIDDPLPETLTPGQSMTRTARVVGPVGGLFSQGRLKALDFSPKQVKLSLKVKEVAAAPGDEGPKAPPGN